MDSSIIFSLIIGLVVGFPYDNNAMTSEDYFRSRQQSRRNFCPQCSCGVANQWTRIVGGAETLVNQYPWVAALAVKRRIVCGATLINDQYVITAAHCVRHQKRNKYTRVVLSEHFVLSEDESRSESHSIDYIITHPDYNRNISRDNDLALIRLVDPVVIRREVLPACLPPPDVEYTGHDGVVSGWGRVTEGGDASPTLLSISVPVLSRATCLAFSNYTPGELTDTQFCAGYIGGGYDSCQGDSGGSLLVETITKRWIAAGIVSWGKGCARPHAPGIYVKVNRYLEWILDSTTDACYCY